MNNGKGFSKIREPTERGSAYHLKFGFLLLFSVDERLELGNHAIGKDTRFPMFRSERKKRTTSGGSPQFLNGFSRKITLPFDFQLKFPDFLAKW